jgi:ribonuclease BN (tRNA processing enzyme)
MRMKVTVLGSGSAFNADRNPSGYAVDLGERLILMDLGFGNLRRLERAKLDPRGVTDVLITHRHPDHVGDLAALLFLFRYDAKPQGGTLRLWGPRGFSDFVNRLQAAHEPWCGPKGYALEVRDLSSGELMRRDGWMLETLTVPHPTPALAYRLSYKGKSLVYSGDTAFSPELCDFAAETDLFLLECASSESEAFEGHMTPRVALATLEASRCRRGVLTHLSKGALEELSRLKLPRGVSLAADLGTLRA